MADNLLKQYMAGGMMKKENKMGHGGYMPEAPKDKKVVIMQEGNMMPSEAPEKEMNKDRNIHHCNYCEKQIPIIILENEVEWTGGHKIEGKIGRYCNPCKKQLEKK